jgi:DNA processing protein
MTMNHVANPNEERIRALILLAQVPWFKHSHLNTLVNEFGEPEEIVKTSVSKLRAFDGLGEVMRADVAGAVENLNIDRVLKKLSELNISVVTLLDEKYPVRIKEIDNPPIALFLKGNIKLLDTLSISIVGSRKASKYGLTLSERIAADLAELGITIVSGMALGIDGAAHNGALNVNGKTVAVLGCGADIVYPTEHRDLYNRILENGLIVSEYPAQSEPKAPHFPERNRIISGLAHAVVVIEAPRKSGALITASAALEQGRDVFAVPGLVTNPASRGCHHLIKCGQAALVESADDILVAMKINKQALLYGEYTTIEQLDLGEFTSHEPIVNGLSETEKGVCAIGKAADISNPHSANKTGNIKGYTTFALDPLERKVLEAVSYEGTHINELARNTGLTIANLSAVLTMLEIKGVVTTSSGGYYQRI